MTSEISAVISDLATRRYAFLDAGCGEGGSIDHLQRRFGRAPGLGLDYYRPAVDAAMARGFDARHCDLLRSGLELPEGCVEFAAAMDLLEHLPSERDAATVLAMLGRAARSFVLIRHPSFEDMDYLTSLGLKLSWTEWGCHPNRLTLADFRRLFAALGWTDYSILPHMLYVDSSDPWILPATAPPDTVVYEASRHGPKPQAQFDRPVYGKFDIFVRIGEIDPAAWRSLASVDGWEAHSED